MDIAAHIGQLVLQHECVIIPGLGAFLTNYHAAEINPRQYSIQPPKRNLVFNAQLNSNDGLLAHYLSQRMNIPYKTSMLLLEVFATYCQRDLSEGKQIAFGDLGVLDMNSHHKLEFYPNTSINYNEDAFGLKSLAIKPIERKPDFGLHAPIQKSEVKIQSGRVIAINRTLRKAAAVLIPLAFLVGAAFYLPTVVQNKQLNETSVFSFLDSLKSSLFSSDQLEDTATEIKAAKVEETPVVEIADPKTEPLIQEETPETIAAPVSQIDENKIENSPKGKYHIICGSFFEKERAEAYISQLNSEGYHASLAGQSKTGSYRVSIQSFTSAEEASDQIKWFRQMGYDRAWILNKRF